MRGHEIIQKELGETPLQAIERFRAGNPALADVSLSYAGRLDPMATGALLVLIGDECKQQTVYHGLDKIYEFEVLLECRSDTGDVLGLAEHCERASADEYDEARIHEVAQQFTGPFEMRYPVFSSKPVDGKPLFQHVYDGTLDSIEVPTATVRIHNLEYCGLYTLLDTELHEIVKRKIDSLQLDAARPRPGNDFRKSEILAQWKALKLGPARTHTVLTFRATVSAGTYIRALAPALAESLGTCGLALSIHRREICLRE